MEIRVKERLTGTQIRERILLQYGSVEALEEAAKGRANHEAKDDLLTIRLLEKEPHRLTAVETIETVTELEPEDIRRLTPQRLRLLDFLANAPRPMNLRGLVEGLGRDKKNVSEDIRVLEKLGLLFVHEIGRELELNIRGSSIHIELSAAQA